MKNCQLEFIDLNELDSSRAALLEELSIKVRHEFNVLTEEILNATDRSIYWLCSSIVSRDKNQSPLFMKCCYLALIRSLLDSGENIQAISVPDRSLKSTLDSHFAARQNKIKVYLNGEIESNGKRRLKRLYGFAQIGYQFLLMYLAKDKKRKCNISDRYAYTLFHTFILPGSFSNGDYEDRYFTGVLDNLPEDIDQKQFLFVPHFHMKNGFKRFGKFCEESSLQFIMKHDYLKLRDYISTLLSPIKTVPKELNQIEFLGFRVFPLIHAELTANRWHLTTLMGILNNRFAKRLAENNIRIRLFVDWFENQATNKGINKGMKDYYPETYRVGYQGFVASFDNPHLFPTDCEVKGGGVPEEVAVMGSALVEREKVYCEGLHVTVAPAFRYAHLWDRVKEYPKKVNSVVILVVLPLIEEKLVIDLLKQVLERNSLPDVLWRIKPHPAMGDRKLRRIVGYRGFRRNCEFVKGSFFERLIESDIVITGDSSAYMEAMCMGIPALVVCRKGSATQFPIPKESEGLLFSACHSADEIVSAIRLFVKRDVATIEHRRAIGVTIREEYFQAVTNEGIQRFLKIDGNTNEPKFSIC